MIIETLRKPRIFKIAIFDVFMSILMMMFIFHMLGIPKIYGALSAIPLGIIVHYIFGVKTQLNHYLGISEAPQ